MTEAEWVACNDTRQMLNALNGKASEKKLRLIGCACCRLVWHLLPDLCHRLVEAVEDYADNEATTSDLASLFNGYRPDQVAKSNIPGGDQAAFAVGYLDWRWGTGPREWRDWYSLVNVARSAAEYLAKSMSWKDARLLEGQLLHDLFGPPAFRPVTINPRWRTVDVLGLARAIMKIGPSTGCRS